MKRPTRTTLLVLTCCGLAACGKDSSNAASDDSAGGAPTARSADVLMAQQSSSSANNAGGTDAATANHTNGSGTSLLARLLDAGGSNTSTSTSTSTSANGSAGSDGSVSVGVQGAATPRVPRPTRDPSAKAMAASVFWGAAGGTATVEGFEQANGSGWVLNANYMFDGPPFKKHRISGEQSIVATWDSMTAANRSLAVDSNVTESLFNGDTVHITSLDPNVDTLKVTAEGRAAQGNVTLTIVANEHRVRTHADGSVVFDHNITTDPNAPIVITNTYDVSAKPPKPTSRVIASGTGIVHHNLAKFSATHAYTALTFDLTGTCLCPQSGTISQVVTQDDGSATYTRTYTYTACGVATVVTSGSTLAGTANGSTTLTFENCTP